MPPTSLQSLSPSTAAKASAKERLNGNMDCVAFHRSGCKCHFQGSLSQNGRVCETSRRTANPCSVQLSTTPSLCCIIANRSSLSFEDIEAVYSSHLNGSERLTATWGRLASRQTHSGAGLSALSSMPAACARSLVEGAWSSAEQTTSAGPSLSPPATKVLTSLLMSSRTSVPHLRIARQASATSALASSGTTSSGRFAMTARKTSRASDGSEVSSRCMQTATPAA
mmetsp:Transcript_36274/g.87257  ORF Transcript_36274/g.87257 Transcript_36274/m.87257 type:complete len:225 (+) Transcript_36274:1700-2374(+)